MKDLPSIFSESNRLAEENLSDFACKDRQAWRLKPEKDDLLRTGFAVDRDRILYSGAYRRYQGKTQVFSFTNMFDEEMTNRSLHTTYVSQIARTIGKVLRLNLELIEAIALGHDLGHTPFGHEGERALNSCCVEHNIGSFRHNVASLFIVDYITKRGRGLNLTFQVRDGIVSHDGEIHNTVLRPDRSKSQADIEKYVKHCCVGAELGKRSEHIYKAENQEPRTKNQEPRTKEWMPATLEGCVVRFSDTISYIGKDIEDAIRFNILKEKDLPQDCIDYFGKTNSDIINTLIKNVILNSYGKDCISLDDTASEMLVKLKEFNYRNIYGSSVIKSYTAIVYRSMRILFAKYLEDIEKRRTTSKIFRHFLDHKSDCYLDSFTAAEKVRDYITTMTDRYFNEEIKDYLIPWKY